LAEEHRKKEPQKVKTQILLGAKREGGGYPKEETLRGEKFREWRKLFDFTE